RAFPPKHLAAATIIAIEEITEILNPLRRSRTYPRVVKRHYAKYHIIKRKYHHDIRHGDPPKIHIYNIRA
ncbi:MAG: hypothetical protein ACR2GE_01635, partial [Pseudonocardia sp.]